MVSALTPPSDGAACTPFGVVVPNGIAMDSWTPKAQGRGLSSRHSQLLAPSGIGWSSSGLDGAKSKGSISAASDS
jgi:hypothetical protein